MPRKWEVVAVYTPATRTINVRDKWGRVEHQETVTSPWAGVLEFKFTVEGNCGPVEAIDAVRESGYFIGQMRKEFAFAATEKFDKKEKV